MLHNGKTFIYVVKDYYILDPEYICGGDRNGGISIRASPQMSFLRPDSG